MATTAPQQFPQLTYEQAKEALDEAIASFEIPSNRERMEAAIASCQNLEPGQKMMILLPLVQEIQGETMKKYGFEGPGAVMNGTMQIQMHAMKDPEMQEKVKMLMAKASGQ